MAEEMTEGMADGVAHTAMRGTARMEPAVTTVAAGPAVAPSATAPVGGGQRGQATGKR